MYDENTRSYRGDALIYGGMAIFVKAILTFMVAVLTNLVKNSGICGEAVPIFMATTLIFLKAILPSMATALKLLDQF